ncbi:hypothetical protein BVRB_7g178700 [Beta vulgaris subsp. vulgaris]|uniref:C3H1-type domain-containing protein n=1 Tax=Beta vulgaris subsp. vulgaris TaxID=3555 RepID=A0A0J8BAT9_BETVV|nr:hypothetical protein BVRB_7g178700 [Beta vulgaris subsp. vulgaris]
MNSRSFPSPVCSSSCEFRPYFKQLCSITTTPLPITITPFHRQSKIIPVGNVYIQYLEEEQVADALRNLTRRLYSGRPIIVDFSPVTGFREATCRQYEENTCNRGGYCNFMHLKKINREL